MIETWSF